MSNLVFGRIVLLLGILVSCGLLNPPSTGNQDPQSGQCTQLVAAFGQVPPSLRSAKSELHSLQRTYLGCEDTPWKPGTQEFYSTTDKKVLTPELQLIHETDQVFVGENNVLTICTADPSKDINALCNSLSGNRSHPYTKWLVTQSLKGQDIDYAIITRVDSAEDVPVVIHSRGLPLWFEDEGIFELPNIPLDTITVQDGYKAWLCHDKQVNLSTTNCDGFMVESTAQPLQDTYRYLYITSIYPHEQKVFGYSLDGELQVDDTNPQDILEYSSAPFVYTIQFERDLSSILKALQDAPTNPQNLKALGMSSPNSIRILHIPDQAKLPAEDDLFNKLSWYIIAALSPQAVIELAKNEAVSTIKAYNANQGHLAKIRINVPWNLDMISYSNAPGVEIPKYEVDTQWIYKFKYTNTGVGKYTRAWVIDTPVKIEQETIAGEFTTDLNLQRMQVRLTSEAANFTNTLEHGTGVATLLGGKRLGVATEARMVNIGIPDLSEASCDSSLDLLKKDLGQLKEAARLFPEGNSDEQVTYGVANFSNTCLQDPKLITALINENKKISFFNLFKKLDLTKLTNDKIAHRNKISNILHDLGEDIVIVQAAGNNGEIWDNYTGLYPDLKLFPDFMYPTSLLTVGMTNHLNFIEHVGDFSSGTGKIVDLYAPGYRVPTFKGTGEIIIRTGTSLAAPQVSGYIMRLIEQLQKENPDNWSFTPEDIANIIRGKPVVTPGLKDYKDAAATDGKVDFDPLLSRGHVNRKALYANPAY